MYQTALCHYDRIPEKNNTRMEGLLNRGSKAAVHDSWLHCLREYSTQNCMAELSCSLHGNLEARKEGNWKQNMSFAPNDILPPNRLFLQIGSSPFSKLMVNLPMDSSMDKVTSFISNHCSMTFPTGTKFSMHTPLRLFLSPNQNN